MSLRLYSILKYYGPKQSTNLSLVSGPTFPTVTRKSIGYTPKYVYAPSQLQQHFPKNNKKKKFPTGVHTTNPKYYFTMEASRSSGSSLSYLAGAFLASLTIPYLIKHQNDQYHTEEKLKYFKMAWKSKIIGDGNCQYRAIADQLWNDQERYTEVRKSVTDWLENNKNYYVDEENTTRMCDFLVDIKWPDYVAAMRKNYAWGDQLTLTAAAEIYQMNIWVLSTVKTSNPENAVTVISPKSFRNKSSTNDPAKTIYLLNLMDYHYESLKPKL